MSEEDPARILLVIVNTPQAGLYEYNAFVRNHKYIQHEGEARGLYVLVVTHECIILIQPSLGCINWFVAQYTSTR